MASSTTASRLNPGRGDGVRRHPGRSADGEKGCGRRPRPSVRPGRHLAFRLADALENPTVGQAKRTRLPDSLDPKLRALLVRTARVGALCHAAVRAFANPGGVGGAGRGSGLYVERATEGDRTILDEFVVAALWELAAIRDENLKVLEGALEPRIAAVRAARIAAERQGIFPPARSVY